MSKQKQQNILVQKDFNHLKFQKIAPLCRAFQIHIARLWVEIPFELVFFNFLGGSFTWYGLEAYWYYISDGEQDINSKVNPMEKVFPKVTKCIYKRFGPTASIETNDALCTVPLYLLNEKIFVILWFVYWALRILMAIGVTHRILMLFRPFRWVYYSLDLNVKFSTIRHLDRRKTFVLL